MHAAEDGARLRTVTPGRPTPVPVRLLRYAWAAPCSLVGLALALFLSPFAASMKKCHGVLEVAMSSPERFLGRLLQRVSPFGAITLGHVVIGLTEHELHRSRRHERAHVAQYERWGVFFFPAYAAASLAAWLAGKRLYEDNLFEVEARRAERE